MLASVLKRDLKNLIQRDASPNFQAQNGLLSLRSWWRSVRSLNTILLYDLTSTYFEGKAALIPKAKRGYSRDHRPDCKQLVVGLVIGREGFPRAHEIFEGNTQDRRTLASMLDLLERRVGLPEGSTVVVDRGMAFAENIA